MRMRMRIGSNKQTYLYYPTFITPNDSITGKKLKYV